MSEENVQFLPFHAINEYMLTDYRQQVIQTVLARLNEVEGPARSRIQSTFRSDVQIPGFRDSNKAPLPMRVRKAVDVFQNNPDFTAAVLSAWVGLNPELRQQVYDLLIGQAWDVLPVEADRAALPGFQTVWPSEEGFTVLDEAFRKAYPDSGAADDDINLMITWLSARLPYSQTDEEKEEDSDSGE